MVRSAWIVTILILSCFSLASCRARLLVHDERAAAEAAHRFGELAFEKGEFSAAYECLSPEMQQAHTEGEVTDLLSQMSHGIGPGTVRAVAFEPIPGTAAMNVYLDLPGQRTTHYRVLMVGDAVSGYHVGGFWKRADPAPATARPLARDPVQPR